MCMSVKTIEERLNASKNNALMTKLIKVSKEDNIDNYSLCMLSDSYEFKMIYALKRTMVGVVKIYERLNVLKTNLHKMVGVKKLVTA